MDVKSYMFEVKNVVGQVFGCHLSQGNMHIPSLAGTAEQNTNAHLVADASPLGAIALQNVPEGKKQTKKT